MEKYADFACRFVNNLVPGKFEQAKLLLTDSCEYYYANNILKGPNNVVAAFEASHENAKTTLDAIEYLLAQIISTNGTTTMIGVQDKITLNNREHTYSDRLEIEVSETGSGLKVNKIKHCPIAIEREKLNQFKTANSLSFAT